ncbi:hypothetical protein ACSBL2_17485 [Pedobacter sp. AW31-3R]|uniref:hypothetical protein n=1 Tax=Pedobacter sp. AW31-3R TaxID=3445781 RepID=UPI003FA1947E
MNKLTLSLKILLLIGTHSIQAIGQTDSLSSNYKSPLFDYTSSKSTFKLKGEQLENRNRFLRYYLLSGYREGVPQTIGNYGFKAIYENDTTAGTTRVYMINMSVEDLLTHGLYPQSNVVLEVKDPSKYRYNPTYGSELEWMRKNLKCFEMVFPAGTIQGFPPEKYIIESLLNVTTEKQKRITKIFVLIRTSKKDRIKAPGGGITSDYSRGHFTNVNIGELVSAMSKQGPLPVIDQTGYKGLVDIQLEIKDWNDISAIQKALAPYDLSLSEEMREIEMFVIKEIN